MVESEISQVPIQNIEDELPYKGVKGVCQRCGSKGNMHKKGSCDRRGIFGEHRARKFAKAREDRKNKVLAGEVIHAAPAIDKTGKAKKAAESSEKKVGSK